MYLRSGSPRRTQVRKGNGEFRRRGILQGVNQDQNLGDAVFSDGPLAWDTRGETAVEWLPERSRVLTPGVHLRPLLPGDRRADSSVVKRIRLAFGVSHPRRRGVFQSRPAN